MAPISLVDGDGWISDDSSFYGDDETRSALQKTAQWTMKRAYHSPFPQAARRNTKLAFPLTSSSSVVPRLQDESHGAMEFEVPDRWAGIDGAWQRNETIHAFLRRKPVDDPLTSAASSGGWLWVDSPRRTRAQVQQRKPCDMSAFMKGGLALLEAFEQRRAIVERDYSDQAPGTIARELKPHRNRLKGDLLAHAVSTGMTVGKWMLFPGLADLPRFWRVVATATSEGRLGPSSKTSIYNPRKQTVICVYSDDFSDSDDVRRVLHELVDLNACSAEGKPIRYKCDAYTYLGIYQNNDYKLDASIYSSKDLLRNEIQATLLSYFASRR